MDERYAKQLIFSGLGAQGQKKLAAASVFIAGVGALGGHLGQLMVRAGVGRVRMVDRDYPEPSNLNRQILYDETDLAGGKSKAQIAGEKLGPVNRLVEIEALTAEIGPDNVCELVQGVDLILDGLDNPPTRFMINQAAVKLGIPWIYTGVAASGGNIMFINPGQTPCLQCIYPVPPQPDEVLGVSTVGIIGPTPAFAAAYASAQALKFLSGQPELVPHGMFNFDLWASTYDALPFMDEPQTDCPCCVKRRFELINTPAET